MKTSWTLLFGGLMMTHLCAQGNTTAVRQDTNRPDLYVTVPLDAYANGWRGEALQNGKLSLDGVPFQWVQKAGADHLFLKDAGWSDWKSDPADFYAAYDSKPEPADARRPIFQVPVADYAAVYLLAATDDDESLSPVVTFRMGIINGFHRVVYHDFAAQVPRRGAGGGANVLKTLPAKGGSIYLLRIPLGAAIAQDFRAPLQPYAADWQRSGPPAPVEFLDVEVTKELRLAIRRPDPCRFNLRPLGLPSGVRIYGMTFMKAPVEMEVGSRESGHVFNEPQVPAFQVTLRNITTTPQICALEAEARDAEGHATSVPVVEFSLKPLESRTFEVPVKVSRRGYHDLTVTLKVDHLPSLRRDTSFALLPADTRKHRAESPFGTWDFGGAHFTPDDADVVGPLYTKAGLRYGMFHSRGYSSEARKKYGVVNGNDFTIAAWDEGSAAKLRDSASAFNPDFSAVKRLMVFHESVVSGLHCMRVPDMFTGRPAYRFSAEEERKFKELWRIGEASARAVLKELPGTEIYFGNTNIPTLEPFLIRKFPRELMGTYGNESPSFMHRPESQPLDWLCNNSSLWMERTLLDHYGYKDVPLRQCYEACYPATTPGNLTPRTQAAYLVRHVMHSLAWGIPVIRPLGIADAGNSYYFSHWGAATLCYAKPDVRPKPAYVAYATLTLVLDGAKFTRMIPTGSPVVYAAEFKKPDGGVATCLWTARGPRTLRFEVPAGDTHAVKVDMMGNEQRADLARAAMGISEEPVFLLTPQSITAIKTEDAAPQARPQGEVFRISALDTIKDWTVESASSHELETYNFMTPRRKGEFSYREIPSFAGEKQVLEVKPKSPVPGSAYLPMYSVLAHRQGVEIPGRPTEIGLMVHGNGGWGRVIFELEDASGQRWTSIGAEAQMPPPPWLADTMSADAFKALKSSNVSDWNTDDAWGVSHVNFEGWRYLRFPLPGNYPGEGYHWPYSSQWRFSGDGVVKYPLKFKKLIVTIPEKILYVKDYISVPRQEIYFKDLLATYEPVEEIQLGE